MSTQADLMNRSALTSAALALSPGGRILKQPDDVAEVVPEHVRLKATSKVKMEAVNAAMSVADAGGSPRAQIDAARKASGSTTIGYLPHQGARERARRLKRMAAAQ